ncbi:hypothetical protein ACFPMF_20480 [Larkinella bovis]|uniref:Uncharacterized protein n=1 Tax=Larkinella bovis TaxID=683041 RepID=A0ABW0IEM7_9BACT
MKILLLSGLLLAGLRNAGDALRTPSLSFVSDTVFVETGHRDLYLHPSADRPSAVRQPARPLKQTKRFAKGLLFSMMVLVVIGWLRQRER